MDKKKKTQTRRRRIRKFRLFVLVTSCLVVVILGAKIVGGLFEPNVQYPNIKAAQTEQDEYNVEEIVEADKKNNEYVSGDAEFEKYDKYVALTFDDGPSSKNTGKLLDTLKQKKVKATFFMLGQNIVGNENIVKRVFKEGHVIGNHSFSHPDLTTISKSDIDKELTETDLLIYELTGEKPKYIRTPYGSNNETVLEIASRPNILWNVDTRDWESRNGDAIYDVVADSVKDGSIILLHDIHPESVEVIGRLIDYLHQEGYGIITVDELLGDNTSPKNYYGG